MSTPGMQFDSLFETYEFVILFEWAIQKFKQFIHALFRTFLANFGPFSKSIGLLFRHPLGWGALHVAAINGRREVVRALIQAGADPNLPEEYVNIYNTAREKGMHSLGM